MNILKQLLTASLGTVVIFLGLSERAVQAFQLSHLADDTEFTDLIEDLAFVAEGRIGDNGTNRTFELDIHEDDPGKILPGDSANFAWTNSVAQAFSLSYNQTTNQVLYTVGNVTLDYTPKDPFTDIFIRTRASSNSEMLISNLVLNGKTINDQSWAVGTGDSLDYLRISGLSSGSFTLTGTSLMSWTGSTPTNSNLAYQIKVGSAPPPAPSAAVPEPSTILGVLSVTAIGAVLKRRQKPQIQ